MFLREKEVVVNTAKITMKPILRILAKPLGQNRKDIEGQVMWCIILTFRFLVSQSHICSM